MRLEGAPLQWARLLSFRRERSLMLMSERRLAPRHDAPLEWRAPSNDMHSNRWESLRPQVLKLTDRNSIANEGEAFQPMSLRLAVKVAFWCSTV